MPGKIGAQGINQRQQRYDDDQNPHPQYHADRLDAEGGDAVKRQPQHLLQRIFRLSRRPLLAVIIHAVRLVADQRHHAPQKEVRLPVFGELLHGPPGHQPEIRVVVHCPDPHQPHQLIEQLGCGPLEKGVRPALLPDTVYDVTAPVELVHHLLDDRHVVL